MTLIFDFSSHYLYRNNTLLEICSVFHDSLLNMPGVFAWTYNASQKSIQGNLSGYESVLQRPLLAGINQVQELVYILCIYHPQLAYLQECIYIYTTSTLVQRTRRRATTNHHLGQKYELQVKTVPKLKLLMIPRNIRLCCFSCLSCLPPPNHFLSFCLVHHKNQRCYLDPRGSKKSVHCASLHKVL